MMYVCPHCGSKKVFHYRLDSDWTTSGDVCIMNDEKYYTEEELEYDSTNRPDIEMLFCAECDGSSDLNWDNWRKK